MKYLLTFFILFNVLSIENRIVFEYADNRNVWHDIGPKFDYRQKLDIPIRCKDLSESIVSANYLYSIILVKAKLIPSKSCKSL